MFRNLLPRLFGDDPAPQGLSDDDAEMAIAALLVRVARADHQYGPEEQARIDAILSARRGMSAADAAVRRAAAELLEAEAPDTVRFTRAVKDRVPLDQRVAVISLLWDIVLADDHRAPAEESAIRLIANLLGVSDVDSALARQGVEAALRQPD